MQSTSFFSTAAKVVFLINLHVFMQVILKMSFFYHSLKGPGKSDIGTEQRRDTTILKKIFGLKSLFRGYKGKERKGELDSKTGREL
jgi:hypothetical protein